MAEIAAIILSAGEGRRAGGPKAFLPIDGECFLTRVSATLAAAGLDSIVAVVRARDLDAARACAPSAIIAANPRPERGMLSSVRTGIDAAGDRDGYCVIPVDHPLVQAGTVRALVAAFAVARDAVVRPMHGGRPGHPIIIPREVAERVPAADERGGLAAIISGAGARVIGVEVPDDGVHANINSLEDGVHSER